MKDKKTKEDLNTMAEKFVSWKCQDMEIEEHISCLKKHFSLISTLDPNIAFYIHALINDIDRYEKLAYRSIQQNLTYISHYGSEEIKTQLIYVQQQFLINRFSERLSSYLSTHYLKKEKERWSQKVSGVIEDFQKKYGLVIMESNLIKIYFSMMEKHIQHHDNPYCRKNEQQKYLYGEANKGENALTKELTSLLDFLDLKVNEKTFNKHLDIMSKKLFNVAHFKK